MDTSSARELTSERPFSAAIDVDYTQHRRLPEHAHEEPVGDCSDQARALLQYSRHFLTSFTASDPCGTSYSTSIVAGMVHLFFFTVWSNAFSGVSPLPHGTFF